MSNNQWPGPGQPNGPAGQSGWPHPQQNPGGYPQPSHPQGGHQSYPKPSYPTPPHVNQQGYGTPPGQPPQAYGQQGPAQPSQGYGQPYGPDGYGPAGYGYGAPTPPKRTNPLLIAAIVVLVLLVGAGGVYLALANKNQDAPVAQPTQSTASPTGTPSEASQSPTPSPTPSRSPSSRTPSPTPTPSPMPSPSHDTFKRPDFPASFGNFTMVTDFETDPASLWETQVYESSKARFVAGYVPGEFLFEIATEDLENPETFGDSICGKKTEEDLTYYACYTKAQRGVLQTATTSATTPSDINAVTQEFLAAWQ